MRWMLMGGLMCCADYRNSGVATKYVQMGYKMMCRNMVTVLLLPFGALLMVGSGLADDFVAGGDAWEWEGKLWG